MKNKRTILSEFVKKYKKKHPELTDKQASKKAKTEYRKYAKEFKKKQKEDKEFEELKKYEKEVLRQEAELDLKED